MGEGIKNLIDGYMDGQPPPGPADPGISGTIYDPDTGEERPAAEVLEERTNMYSVGPLRISEPDAARLTYLRHQLSISSDTEELRGLMERLFSAAVNDALWEYARQAGKSDEEVYMTLWNMRPRRREGEEGSQGS